jgi:hypothetical protein
MKNNSNIHNRNISTLINATLINALNDMPVICIDVSPEVTIDVTEIEGSRSFDGAFAKGHGPVNASGTSSAGNLATGYGNTGYGVRAYGESVHGFMAYHNRQTKNRRWF